METPIIIIKTMPKEIRTVNAYAMALDTKQIWHKFLYDGSGDVAYLAVKVEDEAIARLAINGVKEGSVKKEAGVGKMMADLLRKQQDKGIQQQAGGQVFGGQSPPKHFG